jgi:hypothetical protein
MTDLLSRLQSLTAPDRDIDGEIFERFGNINEQHCSDWCSMNGRTDLTRKDFIRAWAPLFTGSLDAALTLLPEGCEDWTVCRDSKRGLDCWASIGGQDMAPAFTAETPAIALLIAILKANEESKP